MKFAKQELQGSLTRSCYKDCLIGFAFALGTEYRYAEGYRQGMNFRDLVQRAKFSNRERHKMKTCFDHCQFTCRNQFTPSEKCSPFANYITAEPVELNSLTYTYVNCTEEELNWFHDACMKHFLGLRHVIYGRYDILTNATNPQRYKYKQEICYHLGLLQKECVSSGSDRCVYHRNVNLNLLHLVPSLAYLFDSEVIVRWFFTSCY